MKKKNIILVITMFVLLMAFGLIYYNTYKNKSEIPSNTTKESLNSQTPSPTPLISLQTATPISTPTTPPLPTTPSKEETSILQMNQYKLTISIPKDWQKNEKYLDRYDGNSGFIQFGAISGYGLELDEVVQSQIDHVLKPYGQKPQIKNLTINSVPASIIFPSIEITKEMEKMACIIMKFPKPVTISDTPYYYLIIWADVEHIEKFPTEVKFK